MPTTSAAQKNHPDRIIIVEEQNIVQKIGGGPVSAQSVYRALENAA
jgi:hypothetical protein